ncbi:PREDICTED: uncharacterized protein LOC109482237 [Branchiostoma belcheri]|uniref:Uncharacterized protein LOC109482237 n=1 Tax=Branchiostoma belcheri TaxID=7741 RepID=A0A6P5A2B6_BRABE|nr:PREDICTED: uncharacterized protein LOC109482237 [Branchiostoma belcheri]
MAGFESGKRRSPRGRRTPTTQKRKLDTVDSSIEKSSEVSQHTAQSFYNKSSANQKRPYIGPLERKYLREIEEKRAQRSRETSAERPNGEKTVSPPAAPVGPRKYIITIPVKTKTIRVRQKAPLRKSPRKSSSPSLTSVRQSPRKATTPQLKKTSSSLEKAQTTGVTKSAPRTPPCSVDETVYTLTETPSLFSDNDNQERDDTGSLASADAIGPALPVDDATTVESQRDDQKAASMVSSPQRAKAPQQVSPKSSPTQRQTKSDRKV